MSCFRLLASLPYMSIVPGTVAVILANVKHWHGAKADSWFSHIAMELSGEEASNEWLEPVRNEVYQALKG
ncbi:MAG: cupin domain-containing protein [Lachnospiraceae bacterium]|nr:cupin domain-containing protein [Lachnospiraceae bacterium]